MAFPLPTHGDVHMNTHTHAHTHTMCDLAASRSGISKWLAGSRVFCGDMWRPSCVLRCFFFLPLGQSVAKWLVELLGGHGEKEAVGGYNY